MPEFKVIALKTVDKQLARLHPKEKVKVFGVLKRLEKEPIPKSSNVSAMKRAESTYRIRTGKVRILYTVIYQRNQIVITKVGYRKDVYRN